MLPRVNGYEICREVRARGLDMLILTLTAKGQEEDIILGLNLGADDYIVKPFSRGELIARVNTFLRRSRNKGAAVTRFDDYELDLASRRLLRGDKEFELTTKEFGVLAHFCAGAGVH
jgi:two-component system, OmpR family, response regulator MprA